MFNAETESKLAAFVAGFYDDPYGFVMAMWPWGMSTLPDGSPNPLKGKKGPEPWQKELLVKLGDHIKKNIQAADIGMEMEVWRSAIASGHGVGKSAIVAWLIYFFMSTRADTRGVVTASTQFQLEDKTWPELSKWHNLALNKHWFEWMATGLTFAAYPDDKRKNYKTTAATVSAQKTEAFAGLHNEGKTVFIIFDEASGIDDKVWEVADGAMTDGEAFFLAFGNPTRPDGAFHDCFDKHASLYYLANIDSRSVSHSNKSALEVMVKKYGEDSDEVKVRIKGQFPDHSYNGFIGIDIANDAQNRELWVDTDAGLIMAVDAARYGDDWSVIAFRQGRDARSIPMKKFKGLSTTRLAEVALNEVAIHKPDVVVIEGTGIGAGVIDTMRDRGCKVVEVYPGSVADDNHLFINKRMEWWSRLRDWLYAEGCIPVNGDLFKQLTSIQYSYERTSQRQRLESKEDIKKRGLPSPDEADTLALTFAVRAMRRDRNRDRARSTDMADMDYDVLDY